MSKKTVAPQIDPTPNRIERLMAYAIVIIVALSLACFFAVVAATAMGVGGDDEFSHGIWPTIFMFMYLGLPTAFLLIIFILVSTAVRRSRATKAETH